jgi:hypothetical protein
MRIFTLLVLSLITFLAKATLPVKVSDEELINKSDHILVARIVGVEMIDSDGNQILDPNAMIGPGSSNVISLVYEIDEVVISNAHEVPDILRVPLDRSIRYSFGQIQELQLEISEPRLLLLSGHNFQPPFRGVFQRDLEQKDKFMELFKTNKPFKQDK